MGHPVPVVGGGGSGGHSIRIDGESDLDRRVNWIKLHSIARPLTVYYTRWLIRRRCQSLSSSTEFTVGTIDAIFNSLLGP